MRVGEGVGTIEGAYMLLAAGNTTSVNRNGGKMLITSGSGTAETSLDGLVRGGQGGTLEITGGSGGGRLGWPSEADGFGAASTD